jgi:hypothetical protein
MNNKLICNLRDWENKATLTYHIRLGMSIIDLIRWVNLAQHDPKINWLDMDLIFFDSNRVWIGFGST